MRFIDLFKNFSPPDTVADALKSVKPGCFATLLVQGVPFSVYINSVSKSVFTDSLSVDIDVDMTNTLWEELEDV